MTMVAGRMPSLHSHTLQRSHYGEDSGTQGILKTRRAENIRNDDGRRLVRFSEANEDRSDRERVDGRSEPDVITFGTTTYLIDTSDPNSAVRKLFPNSKLTPINPSVNRPNRTQLENSRNAANRGTKSDAEAQRRVIDRNCLRRSMLKVPAETKAKPKSEETLVERIKRLTCEDADKEWKFEPESQQQLSNGSMKDLPKQTKEGLNLMRYKQNISQSRSPTDAMAEAKSKTSPTDEARRSFLSSLSQEEKKPEGEARDRTSVATDSTVAETVYSLSDIEEALTEEEKEIKEAFANEIRQDELELFVQQGAGRTERLRKRYTATPRPDNHLAKPYAHYPQNVSSTPQFYSNTLVRKDKPKFGSTIEILQQLQQQIESPYQLEGRRTACSNYSDSSMPISERLFYDESSDGYEPINTKMIAHRTCSLDSKNYEEIESFPSAFSVPRAKSHEHPKLSHLESDAFVYPTATMYHSNYPGRSQPVEKNVYVSSPDLHGYRAMLPDRFYNSQTLQRQLHPVLQRQYCRYPVSEVPKPSEEGKVLTPPNRMHTYMNVPTNAPCYSPPPPYTKVQRPYSNPSVPNVYHFDTTHNHSNIYQNIPSPTHMKTLRRLCTERERGVPEGASSSQDAKEIYHPQKEYFLPSQVGTIPKQPSVPHQYCVDV